MIVTAIAFVETRMSVAQCWPRPGIEERMSGTLDVTAGGEEPASEPSGQRESQPGSAASWSPGLPDAADLAAQQ